MSVIASVIASITVSPIFASVPVQSTILALGLAGASATAQVLALGALVLLSAMALVFFSYLIVNKSLALWNAKKVNQKQTKPSEDNANPPHSDEEDNIDNSVFPFESDIENSVGSQEVSSDSGSDNDNYEFPKFKVEEPTLEEKKKVIIGFKKEVDAFIKKLKSEIDRIELESNTDLGYKNDCSNFLKEMREITAHLKKNLSDTSTDVWKASWSSIQREMEGVKKNINKFSKLQATQTELEEKMPPKQRKKSL